MVTTGSRWLEDCLCHTQLVCVRMCVCVISLLVQLMTDSPTDTDGRPHTLVPEDNLVVENPSVSMDDPKGCCLFICVRQRDSSPCLHVSTAYICLLTEILRRYKAVIALITVVVLRCSNI